MPVPFGICFAADVVDGQSLLQDRILKTGFVDFERKGP